MNLPIVSKLSPGQATLVTLTKVHGLVIWNTPLVEGEGVVAGGRCNKALVDREGAEELLHMLQQIASFQIVTVPPPFSVALTASLTFNAVLDSGTNVGEPPSDELLKYFQDLRSCWANIDDYQKSLYFCAFLLMGRGMPNPPGRVPAISPDVMHIVQALKGGTFWREPDPEDNPDAEAIKNLLKGFDNGPKFTT